MKEEEKKKSGGALNLKKSLSDVLIKPWITEASTSLTQWNKYVFIVDKKADKKIIAQAVKSLYRVTVTSVNIVNAPKKKRVYGRTSGWKASFKKALVTLKAGDKIDLFQEKK